MWHFGPGPQRGGVPAQILRHLLGRDHRAVGRVARHPRIAIAGDLTAHVRPQPVGADQRRAAHRLAVGELRRDAGFVLVVARHIGAGPELDQCVAATGLQQHAMQIAAMDHGVGIAEARAERLAEIDMGDLAVGHGVHQAQRVDIDRHAARRFADAQAVEAVEGVGPELDAGADLAQLRWPSPAPASRCPSAPAPMPWRARRCRRRR